MQKPIKDREAIGEDRSSSTAPESGNTWPYRMRLTTDHLRWDSLKISHSEALEEHILAKIGEANRGALEGWIPIDMSIHDVDTGETYEVKLVKKESFWFEPTPFVEERVILRKKKSFSIFCPRNLKEVPCYDVEKTRKEFAYSIEPFRQITKKRGLSYGQEIGFRWSGCKLDIQRLEFSVLNVPRLDLLNFRV